MNARQELAREAEAILYDAGCVKVIAKHWGPWWTVMGALANGDELSGHTEQQADPQDPRDLARRLAAMLVVKAAPELDGYESAEAIASETPTFAPEDDPFGIAPAPETEETAAHETHGETGEETALAVGDDMANDGAGHAADVSSEAASWSGSSDDPEQPGRADDGQERSDDSAVVLDADFTVSDLETLDLIDPPEPDFGAELLEFAEQVEAEAEPEPKDDPGGVAYFGDNIHTIRLAKLGRLSQIARELKAALQDGWTLAEFASLQNLIVRIDRGEAPDDPDARARFLWINDRSASMSRIDAFKDAREAELESADRAGVEAFDVEAGWP